MVAAVGPGTGTEGAPATNRGSSISMRAPPSGERPAAIRRRAPRRSRARSPGPVRFRRRRGRGPRRCGGSGRRCARAGRAGCPAHRPRRRIARARPGRSRPACARARRSATVCSIALPIRLRSACASRSGSACSVPARDRPQLEAALAIRLIPSHSSLTIAGQLDRLDAQELRLLGLGQQQQIVHQPADARDLGLHEPLHAAHLGARRAPLRGEHFQLAADHRQRSAQLVRGVGHERALAGERVGEPVEHVVERVGQHPHLVALPARIVDPRMQIAGVHARRHRGHPAQRARHARADQIARPAARRRARASPARMNARATPLWACVTLASGSPTPIVTPLRRTRALCA